MNIYNNRDGISYNFWILSKELIIMYNSHDEYFNWVVVVLIISNRIIKKFDFF